MKIKNFNKKLVLNKKTIANLNNSQMEAAYGGAAVTLTDGSACDSVCGSDPCCATPRCV